MDFQESFSRAMSNVKALTEKTNKLPVLVVIQHAEEDVCEPIVPAIRESISNIICFVALGSTDYCEHICREADGVVDEMIIDADIKRSNSRAIIREFSRLATNSGIGVSYYSDFDCWCRSAVNFIFETESVGIWDKTILVLGSTPLSERIIVKLKNRGLCVSQDINGAADILIGAYIQQEAKELGTLSGRYFKRIYDIGIQNFTKEFIKSQTEAGASCYRSDDRAGMAGVIISIMENKFLVHNNVGRVEIKGIGVVSGGMIGREGDIVVDNAFNPTTVFGVAAGNGTFKRDLSMDDQDRLNKIKSLI